MINVTRPKPIPTPERKAATPATWFIRVNFALTLFLGMTPIICYVYSRLTGAIPSEEVWSSYGGNHGPWNNGWPGDLFMNMEGCLIFLFLSSIPGVIIVGLTKTGKNATFWAKGYALLFLQLCTLIFQLLVIGWVFD